MGWRCLTMKKSSFILSSALKGIGIIQYMICLEIQCILFGVLH